MFGRCSFSESHPASEQGQNATCWDKRETWKNGKVHKFGKRKVIQFTGQYENGKVLKMVKQENER
jgi:hypothetical protein